MQEELDDVLLECKYIERIVIGNSNPERQTNAQKINILKNF